MIDTIVPQTNYQPLPILDEKYLFDKAEYEASLAAAYSLRRFKQYNLLAIKVRRSSDDQEMNIGFFDGTLDIRSLLSFCGTNSGYVVTWYDQSGNGNHATNATAANQPRIVNAGIVDRDFDATKASTLYPTFASAAGVTKITNGNFSSGTTGWTKAAATIADLGGGVCSVTGDGTGASATLIQNTGVTVANRRYLFRATVKVTSAGCANITLYIGSGGSSNLVQQLLPVQNQTYTLQGIVTAGTSNPTYAYIYHQYADAATENGKVMEVSEVSCVDVTDLGQPAVYLDGTNDVLKIANSASIDILGAPMLINSVLNCSGQNGWIVIKNVSDGGASVQYGCVYDTTNKSIGLTLEATQRASSAANSQPNNTQTVYTGQFLSGAQSSYVNGSVSGTLGTYNGSLTSRANMNIGARSNNADNTAWSVFFKGYISEIIIGTSTANRNKIEKNQGKYYGITVV